MDIKFKRKKLKYFKNKNLNPLRCIAIWLPMYSTPCNNQVTDLSSGSAPEMKEQ